MIKIKSGIVCLLVVTLFMMACSANRQVMELISTENEQVEIDQETINIDAIDEFFAQDINIDDNAKIQSNIKIIATGDLMLGTRFPDESYLPEISGYNLFGEDVQKILESGDIAFGNLEGAISSNEGKPKNKKYVFAMPNETAIWMYDAGYNLLSVANNHSGDMGIEGCENTINKLNSVGIYFAGYKENPTNEFERNGIKFGFLAVSPNYGVAYLHDTEWIKEQVEELASRNDIVIVSMHIGAEGAEHQHITRKTEKYLGENRGDPYHFARDVIDAGADLVLGHGPHVTRAIDLYKGRFIAYSLGNFCTISRVNLSGVNGIAPILQLELNIAGEFVLGRIYSTRQYARTGVRMDEENQVLQKIIELTKEDIPETPLRITKDGLIIRK